METTPSLALTEHFACFEDPRMDRTKLHPLLSIVTIAICAVIAGAQRWNDIEEFGQAAEQILSPGGDYVLALKGNQGSLHQDVVDSFGQTEPSNFDGSSPLPLRASAQGGGLAQPDRGLLEDPVSTFAPWPRPPDTCQLASALQAGGDDWNRRPTPFLWGRPPKPKRHLKRVYAYGT